MNRKYKTINIGEMPERYKEGCKALLSELKLNYSEFSAAKNELRLDYSPQGFGAECDGKTLKIRGSLGRGLRLCKEYSCGVFSSVKRPVFDRLGVLFDCAKNKIPNEKTFRDMLLKLALLGYNKAYIAVENQMKLEGEPYFGYGGFRFKGEELRALDDFAYALGIELIPAVSTFTGFTRTFHRFFYWPAYYDADDALCGSQQNVLDLLGKIFDFCKKNFRTDKIHIGINDTGSLIGRWWYYNRYGLKEKDKILTDHVNDVYKLAVARGYKQVEMYSDFLFGVSQPDEEKYTAYDRDYTEETEHETAWSDSFLLFGTVRKRYPKTKISEYLQNNLNSEIRLNSTYVTGKVSGEWRSNFSAHRTLRNDLAYSLPVRCGNFTPHNAYYRKKAALAISACKKEKIKDYTVLLLNDYGGECSWYAHLPVLEKVSGLCYGDSGGALKTIMGNESEKAMLLDLPDLIPQKGNRLISPSEYGLYSDAFLGIYDKHICLRHEKLYESYAARLRAEKRTAKQYAYLFEASALLCEILSKKYALGIRLRSCYQKGDKQALTLLVENNFAPLLKLLKRFIAAVKKEWESENIYSSFETVELHLGGLAARLKTQKKRVEEYIRYGKEIPELAENILNETNGDIPDGEPVWESDWCRIATVNRI